MKKYSKEIQVFIMENVKGQTTQELALLVNGKFGTDFTESKMKSYKANHKLKSGTKAGNKLGAWRVYPPEIRKFIKEHAAGNGPKKMTELINKAFGTDFTEAKINSYYGNNRIDSGVTGYFPKGNIPFNKGKKGACAAGCEVSWFPKGHSPVNHRPVGSERINVDGYIEVKVREPKTWRLKHRVVWEEANGPMPKGYNVIFADGNRTNIDLENLILVSRSELLVLNRRGLIFKDGDLTKAGTNIAKVIAKCDSLTKK